MAKPKKINTIVDEYKPIMDLNALKKSPDEIFLARDMVFHFTKGFNEKQNAYNYINLWSGNGYIESYQLNNGYYEYVDSEWIGSTKSTTTRGHVMGEFLYNQRVHKNYRDIILSFPK